MKFKKIISGALCALALSTAFCAPTGYAAGEDIELKAMTDFKSGNTPKQEEKVELSLEEALAAYASAGYKYTSERYGYSIICPFKPIGVLPLSLLDENEHGDVLIFASEGYDLKHAWIVMTDAFNDKEMPNIDNLNEKEQQALIDKLMNTGMYEFVRIADINDRKGIYAVTAKIIDIDTNGDGVIDETAESDTQMIKTFFKGQFGGNFSIQLIDNPEITRAGVQAYQLGVCTFQEWPTKMQDGKAVDKSKSSSSDKKEGKSEQKNAKKSDKK